MAFNWNVEIDISKIEENEYCVVNDTSYYCVISISISDHVSLPNHPFDPHLFASVRRFSPTLPDNISTGSLSSRPHMRTRPAVHRQHAVDYSLGALYLALHL